MGNLGLIEYRARGGYLPIAHLTPEAMLRESITSMHLPLLYNEFNREQLGTIRR